MIRVLSAAWRALRVFWHLHGDRFWSIRHQPDAEDTTYRGFDDIDISTLTNLLDDTPMTSRLSQLLHEIGMEVARAQAKFPSAEGSMVALMEEVGELAKAMLDEGRDRIRAEAIQVAAMAIRVAIEGDPTLDSYRERSGAEVRR